MEIERESHAAPRGEPCGGDTSLQGGSGDTAVGGGHRAMGEWKGGQHPGTHPGTHFLRVLQTSDLGC